MTLSGFVLFTLGALAELVFLLESRTPAVLERAARATGLGSLGAAWEAIFTPGRAMVTALAVTAGLLVGLFELLRVGERLVYIDTPVIGGVMAALLLAVLGAAILAGVFLPAVTEQSILLVQGLVLAGALLGGGPVEWLPWWAVTVLPGAVSLLLVLWPRAFPPVIKALLYLWYLLCLLALPFQNGQVGLFGELELNWPKAYASGMLLAFLVLHGLFAARFLIIALSMVRARNRAQVAEVMPRLFSDEQTPLRTWLPVAALLAGLLWANQQFGWLELSIALSLCALLGVHLLAAPTRRAARP